MWKYLSKQNQPHKNLHKSEGIHCDASSLAHTSEMFRQLDISKIFDIIEFNTCIFTYKDFHK